MDPLLPFKALSPGTCKSKIPPRNRDTKLSLRPRKPNMTGKTGKENKPPSSLGRWRNPDSNSPYSDLITSDESNLSDPEDTQNARRNSVMTMNSQESTFSLPVAESTRCEIPQKITGNVESTTGTLCTANSAGSSVGTEYFTACPLPASCDDSIVYISDSSPEPKKKVVSMVPSVLITSDESDTEPQTNYLHQNVLTRIRKGVPQRLCDTVILETSHSEDSDGSSVESRPECGIVIPPSIKSDNDSRSNYSAASSFGSTSPRVHVGGSLCNKESGASRSFISENDCLDEGVSKPSSGRVAPTGKVNKVEEGHITELKCNDSSWKDDFHLVLQESSVICEDSRTSNGNTLKTLISGKEPGTISKEKYNDIARWLFSGSNSPESSSEGLPVPAKDFYPNTNSDKKASAGEADDISRIQHPQIKRLSIVKKSSFGSESDDSFNALVNSIKKKRNDTARKGIARKIKDDSFIHDSSDTDESPSPNVYYSDLTKSIRKEVASVHKSVKKMTKRYIPDSSDESDEDQPGSPVLKPARPLTTNFKSMRIPKFALGSDDSDSESPIQQRNTEAALGNVSELDSKLKRNPKLTSRNLSENPKLPPPKSSAETKGKRNSSNHNSSSGSRGSGLSNSDSTAHLQANLPTWRKGRNLPHSVSNSSTSSDSHDEDPRGLKGKYVPTESFKKPISVKKCLPDLTPKKVTALRSPLTSQSPIRTFLSSLSGPSHNPGVRDHPEAAIYNRNFKAKKEELTRRLFKLFNREVFDHKLPADMLLEWNSRLARTAGLCYCKLVRKGGVTTRTAKIALSTKVITSPDRLRDTLIHEMCHAAVWLLNNVSGGHGQFWKAWSHKAMKRFPELPPIERCHSYKIETKYTYKCMKCGYSFGRHSKSLDMDKKRCGYCYGQFEVFLSGKDQEQKQILKTPKAPNAFALFVKENYGLIKQENVILKHADIMKKLSENFAAMKVKNSGS